MAWLQITEIIEIIDNFPNISGKILIQKSWSQVSYFLSIVIDLFEDCIQVEGEEQDQAEQQECAEQKKKAQNSAFETIQPP